MTDESTTPPRRAVDAARLWSGGAATALVAALIAVAGIVIMRGVFDVPVLAPEGDGVWGSANTWWYATAAAFAALLATALVHGFIVSTPQPLRFFSWVIGLATVIAAVAPFVPDAELSAQVATSIINVVLGIAIGTLVASVARSAMRAARRPGNTRQHP